jgi:hypothetical protein
MFSHPLNIWAAVLVLIILALLGGALVQVGVLR